MIPVTISIVTYNNEATIGKTLESLMLHLPEEYSCSVFVIDNGSSDRTLLEIAKYKDRITLINSPSGNIGFGAAHNLVIDQVDSEIHLIVNPDIVFFDDQSIISLIRYLEDHPDVGMVVPRIVDEKGDLQYLCRRNPTILDLVLRFLPGHFFPKREDYHVMKDKDYKKPFEVPFASGCFMAIRTSLFRELGGFDERFFLYAEDADLTRGVNQISKTVYVPDAVVCHLWARASYKDNKMTRIHLYSLLMYFRKWGFRFK